MDNTCLDIFEYRIDKMLSLLNLNSLNSIMDLGCGMQTLKRKLNDNIVLACWIPVRKWRDNFRNKILRPDQTRPDQTRPDQTRPNYFIHAAITYVSIIIQKIKNYNLCSKYILLHRFFVA